MSSFALQAVNKLLALKPNHFASVESVQHYRIERQKPRANIPASLAKICNIRRYFVAEREVIALTPKHLSQDSDNTLMYVHGGAYVSDLVLPHWFIIEYLIKKTGVSVVVPLYRLVPNATIDSELPILVKIYQQVQESTVGNMFVAGDSAGGGLAMALTLSLQEQTLPLPTALFLFSPWLDVTMQNPEMASIQPFDHMLSTVGTRWCGKQWAGEMSVTNPLVSPMFMTATHTLTPFPPMYIYQGTHDIFYADVKKFEQHVQSLGLDCHVKYYQDGFHVFVGLPWLPEAKQALDDVAYQISMASI